MMDQSLTLGLKEYLSSADSAVIDPVSLDHSSDAEYNSMLTIAAKKNLTLQQFSQRYPKEALLIAERNAARWADTLAEAITTGHVRNPSGKIRVNKFIADLFKLKLEQSTKELAEVKQYIAASAENKSERLASVLFKLAEQGNVQAIKLLWERIDGKVGEKSAEQETDFNMVNVYKILHSLFDKQLEVINSGTGTKVICCSRRAGKSHMAAAVCFISMMLKANVKCLYVSKTQKYAEKIFGAAAEQMITDLNLKDSKGQRLKWKQMENGSEIVLRGLLNTKDPDSLRGFKFEIVIIDEFFHLNSELLKYLQDEVLEPMQMDYATSYKMLLMGTPPKNRKTYGEMVWDKTPAHNKYVWTWKDNPYIVNGQAYLDKLFKDKGIDPNSAFAAREYGGLWKYDSDFLLYPQFYSYDPSISLPAFTISKVSFGIDYGTQDQTSVVGVAWDTDMSGGYIFFEEKFNLMTTNGASLIQYLKGVCKRGWRRALDFFPTLDWKERNKRIIWSADCNGMAQSITQELNRGVRFSEMPDLNIQIKDATRTNGKIMQDKIRDLFRVGALLLPEGGPTAVECELVAFTKDAAGNPTSEIDHKLFHPECLTSLRYAMWDLVGKMDVGNATSYDVTSIEGVQYGGSLFVDFEMSKTPQYQASAGSSRVSHQVFKSPYDTPPEEPFETFPS